MNPYLRVLLHYAGIAESSLFPNGKRREEMNWADFKELILATSNIIDELKREEPFKYPEKCQHEPSFKLTKLRMAVDRAGNECAYVESVCFNCQRDLVAEWRENK